MPRNPKGERRLAGGVGTAIMQAKMKFKEERPFATPSPMVLQEARTH